MTCYFITGQVGSHNEDGISALNGFAFPISQSPLFKHQNFAFLNNFANQYPLEHTITLSCVEHTMICIHYTVWKLLVFS